MDIGTPTLLAILWWSATALVAFLVKRYLNNRADERRTNRRHY